jgi:uncharacterized membrane protein YphA (DoxX/SURF4 family)
MKALRVTARLLVGVLFIFSGYVKIIDPMGSAIKFDEYFEAFSMHFLAPTSLVFGILLAVAEFVLGLCMFFGLRMKEASWGALLFMIFFTCLTFILAVFNPVEDCGCFGDAIKLTNWETFFKNIVIMPFVIFIFTQRKFYRPFVCCKAEWAIFTGILIFSFGLAIYAYRHLPLIDFMSYKVGSNILEGREMPEDAPAAVYDNTFIYEKDGVKKEFKIDELTDEVLSGWTYVDTKSKLVSEGYTPPTKDFTISNGVGEYITDSILNLPGYMILLTSYEIEKASLKNKGKINNIYNNAYGNYHFMMLSGSAGDLNAEYAAKAAAQYPIYHTDETTIKSMVRSNPGMILLKDASILKKWSYHDIPDMLELDRLIKTESADDIIKQHNLCEKTTTLILALAILLVFGLIIGISRFKKNRL